MDKRHRTKDWAAWRPASLTGKRFGIAACLCLLLLLSPSVRADVLHDPSGNTLWQDAVTSGGHVATSGGYTLTGAVGEVAGPLSVIPAAYGLFHGIPGPLWQPTPPQCTEITGVYVGNVATFSVKFDEAVQGFDAEADLVITPTGSVAWSSVEISGGPATYQVDIAGITGIGTMTLAVSTESDVMDLENNPLASSVTSAVVVIGANLPIAALPSLIFMSGAITMAGAWVVRKRKLHR